MTRRHRLLLVLPTAYYLLTTGLVGCESWERKFVRKSKPQPPANPIISFEDYTRAMTPLDRYRKHYMMFDYWNDELMDALQSRTLNPKRYTQASREALDELKTLEGLLTEAAAARLAPLIEERAKIHDRLESAGFGPSQAPTLQHALEIQSRCINREFFWRDVEDKLKP